MKIQNSNINTNHTNNFGKDELSKFINNAWHNINVTWIEYDIIIKILNRINSIFLKYIEVFKTQSKEPVISSPAAFLARTYGAYLASVRLSSNGQFAESFVMFRTCIETALYGYYINRKPELRKIWIERHHSNENKSNVRNQFRISNIWKELEQQEPKICVWIKNAYDHSIDFGGHPNIFSIASGWRTTDKCQIIDIFNNDPCFKKQCLIANICFGLGSLCVLRLIYPRLLEAIGIPQELKEVFDDFTKQSKVIK